MYFEILLWLLAKIGEGFANIPSLVIVFVLFVLLNIVGRRIGYERGVAHGVTQQRGANPINAPALNFFTTRSVVGRFFWSGIFRLSIYILTVVYIVWLWGVVFAGLPSFMANPFENMHGFVRAVGVGMQNQPWLVLIVVFVALAEIAGRRVGFNRGVEMGVNLQISPALAPPAATFGEEWRAKKWQRGFWQNSFSWSLILLMLIYVCWLWGINFYSF